MKRENLKMKGLSAMLTEIEFADMERSGLSPDEWRDVVKGVGWPIGGKRERCKRYHLYLAVQNGAVLANPATPIVFALSPNLADKYPKWKNVEVSWDEFRQGLLDYKSWPQHNNKQDISAFCNQLLVAATGNRSSMQNGTTGVL